MSKNPQTGSTQRDLSPTNSEGGGHEMVRIPLVGGRVEYRTAAQQEAIIEQTRIDAQRRSVTRNGYN